MDDDEVWKDLNLTSIYHHPSVTTTTATSAARPPLHGIVFQEFLPCTSKDDDASKISLNSVVTGYCAYPSRKRGSAAIDENVIEKRKKRLMKNRESADRSRARKQAYTFELEYKVATLDEENAKLRKQIQELCVAASFVHHDETPKEKKLQRTSSSPI